MEFGAKLYYLCSIKYKHLKFKIDYLLLIHIYIRYYNMCDSINKYYYILLYINIYSYFFMNIT